MNLGQFQLTAIGYIAAAFVGLLSVSCATHPKPSGPAFDKVNGIPTGSADAGRGRSESRSFDDVALSPRFPVVYFDYNSDKLRPEYPDHLSSVVREANVKWACYVDGFTSSEGTEAYNLALGERRAATVGDYIQAFQGITILETSYGEERPAETLEKSRRVEIRCE